MVLTPESKNKKSAQMIEDKEGFRLPHFLEALLFMYFVRTIKGRWVCAKNFATCCIDKVDNNKCPIVVGRGCDDMDGKPKIYFQAFGPDYISPYHGALAVQS